MHVVQVLAPLPTRVQWGASEVRAMPMPSDDGTESSANSRSGADANVPSMGSLVLKAVRFLERKLTLTSKLKLSLH